MPKSSKRQNVKGRRRKRKTAAYVIFLSHSSADSWIARVMAEKIEALGATCWLDEKDLGGGDVIVDEIINGIDACNEALVLISANSVKSQWVSFEIGGARAQHKRVTPVFNNVEPAQMAPMHDIKGIDLNRFEQFLAQLKRRILTFHEQRKA